MAISYVKIRHMEVYMAACPLQATEVSSILHLTQGYGIGFLYWSLKQSSHVASKKREQSLHDCKLI